MGCLCKKSRYLDVTKEVLDKKLKIELICEPKDFYSHTIKDFKFIGMEGINKLETELEIAI